METATNARKKITPAAACRKGGIHVWVHAVRNAARVAKCHAAIPRFVSPGAMRPAEGAAAEGAAAADAPAAATQEQQEKLADILYNWTDEDDWADTFGMIDPDSAELGSLMFTVVMTKYQAESQHNVKAQRKELYEEQRTDENLVSYFRRITGAMQRLKQAGRDVAMIDFLETFKAGVSQPHKDWTSNLKHDEISMKELTEKVYEKGVHIDGPTPTGAEYETAAFPANATTVDNNTVARIIAEELGKQFAIALAASHATAAAAAADQGRRRPPKKAGGKAHDNKDYTGYRCHACGKKGHISRQCRSKRPTARNDGASDDEEHAFPAVAFPARAVITKGDDTIPLTASSPYGDPAIRLMPPPRIEPSSPLNMYVWDWINREFVDPEDYPEILDPIVDNDTGLTYTSMTRPDDDFDYDDDHDDEYFSVNLPGFTDDDLYGSHITTLNEFARMHTRVKEALLWPGLPDKATVRGGERRRDASRAGLRGIAHAAGMCGVNSRHEGNKKIPASKSLKISAFLHARKVLPRTQTLRSLRRRSHTARAALIRAIHHAAAASLMTGTNTPRLSWVVDSGASRHFSAVKSDFIDLDLRDMGNVSGIDCEAKGIGTIATTIVDTNGVPRRVTFRDVLYVLGLEHRSRGGYQRLMSVPRGTENDCLFKFAKSGDTLTYDGADYSLIRKHGLVWLPTVIGDDEPAASANVAAADDAILHRRLCHLHRRAVQRTASLGIKGLPQSAVHFSAFCRSCALSKATVANINRSSTRDRDPVDPLHSVALDIWGPMRKAAIGGYHYVLGAACYASAGILGELMKRKSDAPSTWRRFLAKARRLGRPIKTVRIDNDSVFLSKEFIAICEENDIAIERTAPYAHHQLGRIERQWRTLAEATKALLLEANLGREFWGLAFMAVIHVRNRVWNSRSDCIPYQKLTGIETDLSRLRVFGCPAYVHIDHGNRNKLDNKAWEGIFVGYR